MNKMWNVTPKAQEAIRSQGGSFNGGNHGRSIVWPEGTLVIENSNEYKIRRLPDNTLICYDREDKGYCLFPESFLSK